MALYATLFAKVYDAVINTMKVMIKQLLDIIGIFFPTFSLLLFFLFFLKRS